MKLKIEYNHNTNINTNTNNREIVMKYTKTKTTTYKINQVAIDMLTFDESYVNIRKSFKYQMFSCHICNKNFKIGDMVSILITDKGNKSACHDCAEKIDSKLK